MKTKQYLAIDIGGTSVKLGIVDETGTVLAKAEESVSFDGYETPILTTVCKAAKAFVEAQNLSPAALVGVGVSATGQIDSRAGTVVGTCGNLPHYIGSPIKAELESLFGAARDRSERRQLHVPGRSLGRRCERAIPTSSG